MGLLRPGRSAAPQTAQGLPGAAASAGAGPRSAVPAADVRTPSPGLVAAPRASPGRRRAYGCSAGRPGGQWNTYVWGRWC